MASPRFIDLFAGIGGTRLSFELEGFECVFSSEWDEHSRLTYAKNFGDLPSGDITNIPASSIPDFETLVAGFPCQPFSSIGARQGFGHPTQGTLFHEIVRILKEKRPPTVLLENVRGLITHDGGRTLRIILDSLIQLGYSVSYEVLDSSEFGVPQKRQRVYLVGFLDETLGSGFAFPKPSFGDNDFSRFIEWGSSGYEITEHLQNSYIFKKADGRPQILTGDWLGPIKTLVSSYYKVQRLTGTFVEDGPTGLRLLTKTECLAAMGFPEKFILPSSRSQSYKQLGNSVTVPVVRAIAKNILTALSGPAVAGTDFSTGFSDGYKVA